MAEQSTTAEKPDLKSIMSAALDAAQNGGNVRGSYRMNVNLLENTRVEVKARNFTMIIDEPASFGGTNTGPNPEEVLLAGVGACQAVTAALYAAMIDIPIRSYSVRLIGDADFSGFYGLHDDPPVGFDRVRCEVTIDADAPEARLREFEQLVEDRCVGHGTLRKPVPIETTWRISSSDAGPGHDAVVTDKALTATGAGPGHEHWI